MYKLGRRVCICEVGSGEREDGEDNDGLIPRRDGHTTCGKQHCRNVTAAAQEELVMLFRPRPQAW